MMQHAVKFRSSTGRKLITGLGWRSSQKIFRQRLHTPERVGQPIPLLALAEHYLPTDDDDNQQRQANAVKAKWSPAQLPSLCREVIRIPERYGARAQSQEADRNIDQEYPTAKRLSVIQPPSVGPTTGAISAATPNSVMREAETRRVTVSKPDCSMTSRIFA